MNWVSIPEDYLLFLRKIDERIPYSDYGKKRFKPFFSPLFEIESYRDFSSQQEKSNYIKLLKEEMKQIKAMDLSKQAMVLYRNKYRYPKNKISMRCFDYKQLEKLAKVYSIE